MRDSKPMLAILLLEEKCASSFDGPSDDKVQPEVDSSLSMSRDLVISDGVPRDVTVTLASVIIIALGGMAHTSDGESPCVPESACYTFKLTDFSHCMRSKITCSLPN